MPGDEAIERCVRATYKNEDLNRWANSTSVSCWVSEVEFQDRMWTEHGNDGPAIRVSIDREAFCRHVEASHRTSHGRVTYGGQISLVCPGVSPRWGLSPAHDEIRFFFFHKRAHYAWEREFRVIVESSDGVDVPMNPDIIHQVTISPLGKIDPQLLERLRQQFVDRLGE